MSTRHLNCLVLITAFLALGFAPSASQESIEDTVAGLGTRANNVDAVVSLASMPARAAGILVKELHTVPETKLLAGEIRPGTEHVLWCLRALRFLTGGKDFCAASQHSFGRTESERNRKYWLEFKNGACLSFFAVWPSRGSQYIAPRDAQKAIIEQWRRWYEAEGRGFDYRPLTDRAPEKWLW